MRDGWVEMTLGEAAEVSIGRQRSPRSATGEHMVRYLRAANVKDGQLVLDDVLTMNFSPAEQETYRLIPGDVLVTEGCGSIRELGASAVWNGDLDGTVCFQNTLLRIRSRDGLTLPDYLAHWARAAHAGGLFAAVASGTNIFHIGLRRAQCMRILLPPLEEQRRIADLISQLDVAVSRARDVAEGSLSIARKLILAAAASAGDRVPLGAVAEVKGGKRLAKGEAWARQPTGHPYIRVTDMRDGRIDDTELVHVPNELWPSISRYIVDADDVVISIAGTIGQVAVVPPTLGGANLTENAARIRPHAKQFVPEFLSAFLQSGPGQREIERLTVGTTQRKLALFRIKQIELPALPMEAQQLIADAHAGARTTAETARDYGKRVERLRGVLRDRLLSGAHDIPASYDALLSEATPA